MKDLFYMSKIDYYSCKRIELSEVHTHSEFSLMGDTVRYSSSVNSGLLC